MTLQDKQDNTIQIVNEITGSTNDPYRKIDLQWKDWFSRRDEIMKGLCSEWYIRRFVPRRKSANEIKLDNPFSPQGDTVIFISVGRSQQNKLAEDVAGQIEAYAKENSGNYEPALRIRSVIFHTADEYIEGLRKNFDIQFALFMKISPEGGNEIEEQWKIVKSLKDEMESVENSITSEIFQKGEITDADILNKWEDLCDICKNGIEKVNDISPKYENTETHQLVKSKGGLL